MSRESPNRSKVRIEELREQLHEHNHSYYNLNQPKISDFQFDLLMLELEDLENSHPEFYDPNSPTQRVGGDITENFESAQHGFQMFSLQNIYSKEELIQWKDRLVKIFGNEEIRFVCELKFDGVSINMQYTEGRLTKAITRGDGQKGDVVTVNVRTIPTIPLILRNDFPKKFEIRGEIILTKKQFKSINTERKKQGKELYKNPRNTAAGTLKLQDSAEVAKRKLDCFFFSVVEGTPSFETHFQMLEKAKEWGFQVFKGIKQKQSHEGILEFIDEWKVKKKDLPYEIDGVVIKVDSLAQQEKLGVTSKFPRWAVAYKYPPENSLTRLKSITYQVGKTGAITPVAELQKVKLSGTDVSRATLHNADQIRKFGLRIGDWVYVEKGGEIIPKITGVDQKNRAPEDKLVVFPEKCPHCDSLLKREEGLALYYCLNSKSCTPQITGKIQHYVSRNAMDIEGIGDEKVNMLFKKGLIKDIADLYLLRVEELIDLPLIQKKSALKMVRGIENSKKQPLWRFLFGLGIRHVGETASKRLAKHFQSLDEFISAPYETLTEIEDIGEIMAQSIIDYFKDSNNIDLIDRLSKIGVPSTADGEFTKLKLPQILKDKKVVVSGVFMNRSRQDMKQLVEELGGNIVSSVSGKTDILLIGESPGASKLQKAKSLNIEVLPFSDLGQKIQLESNK